MNRLVKLQKLIKVLNELSKSLPDVEPNTVQQIDEFFYIRKSIYSVIVFSNVEDCNALNQLAVVCAIINYYHNKENKITCLNGYYIPGTSSLDNFCEITDEYITFMDSRIDRNICMDEYFNYTISNSTFLSYEELQELLKITHIGATINIKNL